MSRLEHSSQQDVMASRAKFHLKPVKETARKDVLSREVAMLTLGTKEQ